MVIGFFCLVHMGVRGVPVHVVYVDQVILGSVVMNYVILWAVGKIGGVGDARWRLLAAAFLGGVYSIAAFVPALSLLMTFGVKIIISLVIIFIAFAPQPPVKLAACLGFFYLASFALGGSVVGIMYLLEGRGGMYSAPAGFLRVLDRYFWCAVILALGGFWAAGRGTSMLLQRHRNRWPFKIMVTIKMKSKQVEARGLLDSGNQLIDPFNGHPVLVAEYEIIKELLPPKLVTYFDQNKDFDIYEALLLAKDSRGEFRFRLIPFQSLGSDSSMLLGFDPEEVELKGANGLVRTTGVTVAICHQRLSPDLAYQVLIHPGLIDSGEGNF